MILYNTPAISDAFEDSLPILDLHYHKHGEFSLGGLDYSRMREEVPAMLSEMNTGARRIKRIVEDLKDFARMDDPIFNDDMDFNAVVQAAVRLVKNSIKKSTEHFVIQCAERLPLICGNAQRIEQVIVNLILNACQALSDRQKSIRLITYQNAGGTQVVLEVQDEGIGIEEDNRSRVTDPFFTTKRESGGTGLGLSVSASIVKDHNGTLDFRSREEGGTIAILTLPVNGKVTET